MKEKIGKRTKKAVIGNLQKLISKYGYDEVRLLVNKYFERKREEAKLKATVEEKEKELSRLKRKLQY